MRHGIVVLTLLVVALIAWRVRSVFASGHELHDLEVTARARAAEILRAELARAAEPPVAGTLHPYEFLETLVAEGRLHGFERVAGVERDLWRSGGYVFHVRLLNRLSRPIVRRPADLATEPGLGGDFELWAWPADPRWTTLALFFGSDAGWLLQGDNGSHAGERARPEDEEGRSPSAEVAASPRGAGDQWIVVETLRGQ